MAGYEVSASNASSANSATGATKFGAIGSVGTGVVGGSTGLSLTTVALIIGVGLAAVWFFVLRKKGGQ